MRLSVKICCLHLCTIKLLLFSYISAKFEAAVWFYKDTGPQKDETMKKQHANDEKCHVKIKVLNVFFAWRFSCLFFVFSRGGSRYLVFSPGVISSFRLVWCVSPGVFRLHALHYCGQKKRHKNSLLIYWQVTTISFRNNKTVSLTPCCEPETRLYRDYIEFKRVSQSPS